MKRIHSKSDLITAIQEKEDSISIENKDLGMLLILVYRMQYGLIPDAVIKRIQPQHICKIAVGEGVVINVNNELAKEAIQMHERLEKSKIELDVAKIENTQINLYYGK